MAETNRGSLLWYQNVMSRGLMRELAYLFDIFNEKSGGAVKLFGEGFTGDYQTQTYLNEIADTTFQRDPEDVSILPNNAMSEAEKTFPKYFMSTEALSWIQDTFEWQGRPSEGFVWEARWIKEHAKFMVREMSIRAVTTLIALASKLAPSSAPWLVDVTAAADTRLHDYLFASTKVDKYKDQAEKFRSIITLPVGRQQVRVDYQTQGSALESVAGSAWQTDDFVVDGMQVFSLQHPTLAAGTGVGTMYSLMLKENVMHMFMRTPPKVLFQTENMSVNPLNFARAYWDVDINALDYSFDKTLFNPDLATIGAGVNWTPTFTADEHIPALAILSADTPRPKGA